MLLGPATNELVQIVSYPCVGETEYVDREETLVNNVLTDEIA